MITDMIVESIKAIVWVSIGFAFGLGVGIVMGVSDLYIILSIVPIWVISFIIIFVSIGVFFVLIWIKKERFERIKNENPKKLSKKHNN